MQGYPSLKGCETSIVSATCLIIEAYRAKRKLLICGNGGSAAGCEHIVGELMKGFMLPRRLSAGLQEKIRLFAGADAERLCDSLQLALPAIALSSHTALTSAFSNDTDSQLIFAQQVIGYGAAGDILFGISTSGNSNNVVYAVKVAKALGLKAIGLTGRSGGFLEEICDVTIKAPSDSTPDVQELHLPIYHAMCKEIEAYFFDN